MTQRTVTTSYSFEPVTATECWACSQPFTATVPVTVVDAADPKMVHDIPTCREALAPLSPADRPQLPA